ncbi:PREDICTED: uncharacterized protein LOC104826092 [Tarenaya hassleriana]|uniref:uncharacterized protein LOC104826092 n=1 Tax=Tarenaya hassleriana TaxID=28532 RepID=UPI00053C5178|nr:PREDICTED: uncharacterized protein LOC104826092 [Tarenaya hassleriana]XP_010556918.1 PREDICTED: uncharacterized protein LOC104826092 [Tarenaya hassleriana]
MRNDTSGARKDDPEQEDSLLKLSNDENLSAKDGFLKLHNSPSQKNLQHLFVLNNGKLLQIVKNRRKGSFFRMTRVMDSKIPRHVLSPDEKFLRRCLELIHISASKYHFDSTIIPMENSPQVVYELPLAGDSGSTLISPAVAAYKSIMHMLDKPLSHKLEALDIDPHSTGRRKDEVKGMPDSRIRDCRSENICNNVVSVSSTDSTCFSSELSFSSSSSASTTISQGTLRFTMNGNGLPRFVFSLDDKKEIFVASLSNAESCFDSGALEHIYLIHLGKGSGNELHLVGKIKVSTLFSVSSSSNSRISKREFVLFSDCGNLQMQCHDTRKSKGFPKKVVDAFNTRASRQRSISRFSRASSTTDFCSWEPFQEPNYDPEPVNLLENDLPPNLESSAVVVEEQHLEEQQEESVGGWGMKFLKKTSLARTGDASKLSTSMYVIIPSGIHGGPRKRNGGPSSLIQRWESGGICDCGGWDLGCPLTVLKGRPRKDQREGQCNLFELFTEGSMHGTPGLRIANVHEGLYSVQFQPKISVLQSFSIAIAYIHSQSHRLRPSPARECTKA